MEWEKGKDDREKERVRKMVETKRNNPDLIKGGKSRYYDTPIGKVFGTYELSYINNLIKEDKELPTKPKGIKTPFNFKINLLKLNRVLLMRFLLEAERDITEAFQQLKKKKVEWVSDNVKPVEIIILNYKGEITKQYIIGSVL